jgi:hypothetical protein
MESLTSVLSLSKSQKLTSNRPNCKRRQSNTLLVVVRGLCSYVSVGKTSAAWDCVLRLVERNLHHPRTLVALTRFATHWQELGAQK